MKNVARPTNGKKSKNEKVADISYSYTETPATTSTVEPTIPELAIDNPATVEDPSTYVATPPTGEMKRDANDILYTVEPNPNSTFNQEQE